VFISRQSESDCLLQPSRTFVTSISASASSGASCLRPESSHLDRQPLVSVKLQTCCFFQPRISARGKRIWSASGIGKGERRYGRAFLLVAVLGTGFVARRLHRLRCTRRLRSDPQSLPPQVGQVVEDVVTRNPGSRVGVLGILLSPLSVSGGWHPNAVLLQQNQWPSRVVLCSGQVLEQ
jgi:hypothetical protein